MVDEIDPVAPAPFGRARDGQHLAQIAYRQTFPHRRRQIADIERRLGARRRAEKAVVAAGVIGLPAVDAGLGDGSFRMRGIVGQQEAGSDFDLRHRGREIRIVVIALHRPMRRTVVRRRLARAHARQESRAVRGHGRFRQVFVVTVPIVVARWPPVDRRIDMAAAADARGAHDLEALGIEQLEQAPAVGGEAAGRQRGMVQRAQETAVKPKAARKRRAALDVHGARGHGVPPGAAFDERDPRARLRQARRRHRAAEAAADDDHVDGGVRQGLRNAPLP